MAESLPVALHTLDQMVAFAHAVRDDCATVDALVDRLLDMRHQIVTVERAMVGA